MKYAAALFLIIFVFSPICADTFRVSAARSIALPMDPDAVAQTDMGYNDALSVKLPEDRVFVRGIEIEIKTPQALLAFPNCIAYALYADVTPEVSADVIDYAGRQIAFQPLPPRFSTVLQIPIGSAAGFKSTPYAAVTESVPSGAEAVFFRLLPVMKGLPDDADEFLFDVRVRLLTSDEGRLTLTIIYPPEPDPPGTVAVSIDNKSAADFSRPIILPSGMHYLSIDSQEYRDERRTFLIERAKNTNLAVSMQDITPLIRFIAPDTAVVWFDETQLGDEQLRSPMKTVPGEHTIRFTIGDYEFVRTIAVEKGKTYDVSLIVDVEIAENP